MFHSLPTMDVNTNKVTRLRVQFKDICPQELLDRHNGDLEEAYKEFKGMSRHIRYRHLYFLQDKKNRRAHIYVARPCVFCRVGDCSYEGFPTQAVDVEGNIPESGMQNWWDHVKKQHSECILEQDLKEGDSNKNQLCSCGRASIFFLLLLVAVIMTIIALY